MLGRLGRDPLPLLLLRRSRQRPTAHVVLVVDSAPYVLASSAAAQAGAWQGRYAYETCGTQPPEDWEQLWSGLQICISDAAWECGYEHVVGLELEHRNQNQPGLQEEQPSGYDLGQEVDHDHQSQNQPGLQEEQPQDAKV